MPCSFGGDSGSGKPCPTRQHAPITEAGAVAWACLTRGFGQWRTADSGMVSGLDLAACLARPSAAGQDPEILELLLLAAEPAAVAAINRRVLAAREG